jgi:hypothetical protein
MATPHTAPVHTLVVGVFDDMTKAKVAAADLQRAGFLDDQINCTCGGRRARVEATNEMSSDAGGDWLEDEIADGHTVLTIRDADERAEDAREILRKHGATIREPSPVGTYGTGLPATPF